MKIHLKWEYKRAHNPWRYIFRADQRHLPSSKQPWTIPTDSTRSNCGPDWIFGENPQGSQATLPRICCSMKCVETTNDWRCGRDLLERDLTQYFGYVNVSALQIMTYLFDNYGDIKPGDLAENNKCLTTPYDISTPIETLWEQIKEATAFSGVADALYTAHQINNTAYNLLHKRGQFKDKIKEWRQLCVAQ